MEETLRYFFSAVFQGYAAIIALGSMFYISYLDRIRNSKNMIADKLANEVTGDKRVADAKIFEHSIIKFVEDRILPTIDINQKDFEFWKLGVHRFRTLEKKENELKKKLPTIIILTLIILTVSLISLFLVGICVFLNSLLTVVGGIIVILSILYFYKLKQIIYSTLELKE